MSPTLARRTAVLAAALTVLMVTLLAAGARPARAGTWTLDSCTHPDGTPAPTAGWTPGLWSGTPVTGSGAANTCSTGGTLSATSGQAAPAPAYTGPEWVFTAPPGTTIAGGQIDASLTAPQGEAWIGTPAPAYDASDVIGNCQLGVACGSGGTASGVIAITHPGGTQLFAPALCVINAPACPVGGGVNAQVAIHTAEIELAETSTPTATGLSGGLVDDRAHGTADLRFVAGDPGIDGGSGPGVDAVTVQIDGATVYAGAPNPARPCTALGTDAATGGQIFDRAQPCPQRVRVNVPVDTTALGDGTHTLTVLLTDAGGDTATAVSRTIRIFNPLVSPAPPAGVVATRLTTGWLGASPQVALHSVTARGLPATGRLTARCVGTGCPSLTTSSVRTARAGRLWSALKGARFRAGQRLRLTIAAYGRPGERIQYTIRRTGRPGQRLLSPAAPLVHPTPKRRHRHRHR